MSIAATEDDVFEALRDVVDPVQGAAQCGRDELDGSIVWRHPECVVRA